MLNVYFTILLAVIPVYLFIVIGYVLRRIAWLTREADTSLLRLQVNLLYPALIFTFIAGNPALRNPTTLIWPPLVGFVGIIAGFAISYLIGMGFRLRVGKGLRTFAFTCGIQNYGFMAIPLSLSLYRDDVTTGILLVHNTGIEVAVWTIGILLLSGTINRDSWKRVFNAPLIALLLGLAVNFTSGVDALPTPLISIGKAIGVGIDGLGDCAIPLALLLIGASVHDLFEEKEMRWQPNVLAGACVARLMIIPAVMLLAAWALPMSIELKRVVIVQASMPAAMFPIVLARHYSGEPRVAVQSVVVTTLLSFMTLPLWVMIGQSLIGD